jgi:hypothetical protein
MIKSITELTRVGLEVNTRIREIPCSNLGKGQLTGVRLLGASYRGEAAIGDQPSCRPAAGGQLLVASYWGRRVPPQCLFDVISVGKCYASTFI